MLKKEKELTKRKKLINLLTLLLKQLNSFVRFTNNEAWIKTYISRIIDL